MTAYRAKVSSFALATLMLVAPASAQTASSPLTSPFIGEQPRSEWLAHVFVGSVVKNSQGDTVGDVKDLVFNRSGKITTVVLGVGGFLGLGEKSVAVPFETLTYTFADNARVIVVPFTKDDLKNAPVFTAIEKTLLDKWEDKAIDLGHKTAEKASELKDQAIKKVDEIKAGQISKP